MPNNTFNHTAHKLMWVWLANNPHKNKQEWPGWDKRTFNYIYNGIHVMYGCFACEYDNFYKYSCESCPFGDYKKINNGCLDGLYSEWIKNVGNLRKRTELALKIANLPLRTDIEIEVI